MATTAAVLRLDAKNLVGASLLTAVIPPGDRRIKKTVLFSMALLYHASSLMGWRKLFWLPKEHTFSKNTRSQSGPSKAVEGLRGLDVQYGFRNDRATGPGTQSAAVLCYGPGPESSVRARHQEHLQTTRCFKQMCCLVAVELADWGVRLHRGPAKARRGQERLPGGS